MKKLLISLIALSFILTAGNVFAKDWKKIRVGVEGAYPPFSFVTPEGELAGFDIEIAKAVVKAAGAEIELVTSDYDGIIPALLAKKFDCIIASLSITEKRKKKVAFTDKYYNTPAKFVQKKGMIATYSKDAIKGKTIGVQRATIHEDFIRDNFGKDVTIKSYGTQDEVYLDMQSGRLDMLFADSVAATEGFLMKAEGKNFEFIGPDFTDPKWFGTGVGIAIRKADTDLVDALNAGIAKIRADGTYKKIQDKYFDFNVYGD
ncbi:MAG: transporter substrate-binding domain-containing protein [Desulfobacula sp.]|nr:transporter substrate-binding domain-containing protein [Desulfobacula sp.]